VARPAPPARPALPALVVFAIACARKNERLSSDTVRSTLFSFTSGGTCSRAREKFSNRLDPGGDDEARTCWA